ncbi:MAG: glycosyltransferase [Flavobacteriaceae bacterium]|nr:glycosyltransferase [Flavobacteriaceae bacterium]
MSKNLLLIFTRNPELGKVKTRLAKSLGDEKALAIYKMLLEKTKSETSKLDCTKRVYYTENVQSDDIWPNDLFEKRLQEGKDLGHRMQNAFQNGFDEGFENVIVIGSDLFDISSEIIQNAFEQLQNNDVVIGPAHDGGYYLLGMKELDPAVFENKNWGTSTVFEDTMKDLGNKKVFLTQQLNDIDVIEDMQLHPSLKHFL